MWLSNTWRLWHVAQQVGPLLLYIIRVAPGGTSPSHGPVSASPITSCWFFLLPRLLCCSMSSCLPFFAQVKLPPASISSPLSPILFFLSLLIILLGSPFSPFSVPPYSSPVMFHLLLLVAIMLGPSMSCTSLWDLPMRCLSTLDHNSLYMGLHSHVVVLTTS